MKLISTFAILCCVAVSQSFAFEIRREYTVAFRWPSTVASCPDGKPLMGGGGSCQAMSGQGFVFMRESNPISESAWRVACDTPKDQDVMAEAWVVCG